MSRFEVGEIALTVQASPTYPQFVANMEVEILAFHVDQGVPGYLIDTGFPTPSGNSYWFATEIGLKKLPPHSEPSTWEKCVFKPEGVTA